jgi:hypothetical protein
LSVPGSLAVPPIPVRAVTNVRVYSGRAPLARWAGRDPDCQAERFTTPRR